MPSDWTFVSVDMELTNQCGSECLMCPRDAITRPKGMMSEEVFNTVSDKLIREGSLITFSGMGDPLSHSKVFEWIADIRKKNGDAGIVINPASLHERIPQRLIESRPNSITISFPSTQKEVFEKLCPTIPFEDALKRTRELVDLSRGNVGVRIAGIKAEINNNESEGFVSFWRELNVSADMTACHGRGGNLKDSDIYGPKTFGLSSGRCGLFQFHTFVTWEAEVLACCHDLTGATRIGNLAHDAVTAIADRKRDILKSSMPFPVCRQCDEPLRLSSSPQGPPPNSRKKRRIFFRSISRNNHA